MTKRLVRLALLATAAVVLTAAPASADHVCVVSIDTTGTYVCV